MNLSNGAYHFFSSCLETKISLTIGCIQWEVQQIKAVGFRYNSFFTFLLQLVLNRQNMGQPFLQIKHRCQFVGCPSSAFHNLLKGQQVHFHAPCTLSVMFHIVLVTWQNHWSSDFLHMKMPRRMSALVLSGWVIPQIRLNKLECFYNFQKG